jgi:hypothetical protein
MTEPEQPVQPTWAIPSPANDEVGPAVSPGPGAPQASAVPTEQARDVPSWEVGAPGTVAITAAPVTPPRRRTRALVGAGAVAVLVAGAFATGAVLRGGGDTALVTPAAQNLPGGAAGNGQGAAGAPGDDGTGGDGDHQGPPGGFGLPGQVAGAGLLAGTIDTITAHSFTLVDGRGATVIVTTDSTSALDGVPGASLSSLRAGQAVMVVGTRAADGSVTARQILTRPPGDGDHPFGGGGTPPGTGTAPGGSSAGGTGTNA